MSLHSSQLRQIAKEELPAGIDSVLQRIYTEILIPYENTIRELNKQLRIKENTIDKKTDESENWKLAYEKLKDIHSLCPKHTDWSKAQYVKVD